jgi:1,4-dihydroxy-2-naphthoate polyprenyltransferase
VIGTAYVQTQTWQWSALDAAIGIGAIACAILVANNLRDIPTDRGAGKITLAVRLGDNRTRLLYAWLLFVAFLSCLAVALITTWWAVLALAFGVPGARAARLVGEKAQGPALIPVLQLTGIAELLFGLGLLIGLALG